MQAQPATNLELQKWIARQHGMLVDAAWIEQSRRMLGTPGQSETAEPDQACIPPEMVVAIKQALRHFGMLR